MSRLSQMETFLAFDTTTPAFSMALRHGEGFWHHVELAPQQHARLILKKLDDLLTQAKITLSDIDALVITRGPGSFTGVRTGIAVAQGLSLGASIPIIGFSTLMVLAEQHYRLSGATEVIAQLDARQGELYWGAFERKGGFWFEAYNERVASPEALPSLPYPWVSIAQPPAYPDAQDALSLALHLSGKPEIDAYTFSAETIEATYLRDRIINS